MVLSGSVAIRFWAGKGTHLHVVYDNVFSLVIILQANSRSMHCLSIALMSVSVENAQTSVKTSSCDAKLDLLRLTKTAADTHMIKQYILACSKHMQMRLQPSSWRALWSHQGICMASQWWVSGACRTGSVKFITSIPSTLITLYMSYTVAATRCCHIQKHPIWLNNKFARMKAGQVKKSIHYTIYTVIVCT